MSTFSEEQKFELPDSGSSNWDAVLNAIFTSIDSGREVTLNAGQVLAQYDAVYIKSDGKIWKAKADSLTTLPAIGLIPTAIASGVDGKVRTLGWITNVAWSWTPGQKLYVSDATAGAITSTKPSVNPQIIGIAKTATKILIIPQLILEKLGAFDPQDSVKDKDLTAPPGGPAEGDRYIVATGGTGAWAGHDNDITEWNGTAWIFFTPNEGTWCEVEDENTVYIFDGSAWGKLIAFLSVSQDDVGKDDTEAQEWTDPLVSLKSNLNRIRHQIVTITGEAWGTVSHTIASIWAKFHATTGHKHTGAANDSPKLVDIDSLTGAKYSIEDHTEGSGAPHQIEEADNRKILTNRGSTALNYHTLPSAAAGLGPFTFVVVDSDGLRCDASNNATIRIAGNVTPANGNVSSTVVGSVLWLIALSDSEWMGIATVGSWNVST